MATWLKLALWLKLAIWLKVVIWLKLAIWCIVADSIVVEWLNYTHPFTLTILTALLSSASGSTTFCSTWLGFFSPGGGMLVNRSQHRTLQQKDNKQNV